MAAAAAAGAGDPVFYPLLLIGEQALRDTEGHLGLETFWQVVESRRFLSALLNTLQIAVIATSGCLLLGSVLALILVFIPFPGSQLISRIIDTFIALPTFLITTAFTFIYGSAGLLNGTLMSLFAFELPPVDFLYSIQGVILAEMTVFTPLVMRPLMAGLRQIDKSQLEAASILGAHPLRVIGRDFSGGAAGANGGRQPVSAVDHQRVRHRAVYRRQRGKYSTDDGLQQGYSRVGLQRRLHDCAD